MDNLCPRVEIVCITSSVAEFERPNIPAGRVLMAYSTYIDFFLQTGK